MVDTDERQAVSALAEQTGWNHRVADRSDYFNKGVVRVHVVWRGESAISGGTHCEAHHMWVAQDMSSPDLGLR